LFNTINEGFAISDEIETADKKDKINYRLIEVNPAFGKKLGLPLNKIIGKTISEIFPRENKCWRYYLEKVSSTSKPVQVTQYFKQMDKYFNVNIYRTDSKRYAFLFRDITEQKIAEKALQESKANYRTIFETTRAATIIFDDDMVITLANMEFEFLSGYSKQEVQNKKKWTDFIFEEDFERINDFMKLTRIDPVSAPRNNEFRFIDRHNNMKDLVITVAVIPGNNRSVASFIDITQRKQMEREMSRLDQLNVVGELAASIGHEIRNPMTSVRGFLQMLKENINYKEHGYYDLMIEELDRANSIITEFLSLAKNKAVDLKLLSLNSIIESLYPLIQADAIAQDKYVNLELSEIPPLLLDEKEIRQLILNLARNGLEAMDVFKTLTIKTSQFEGEVILAVEDEGKGIHPEVLEKIGSPFFTTKEQGTGLGLSVCYSIIARIMQVSKL